MKIKLAEALLRRKELQQKIQVVSNIRANKLVYEVTGKRVNVMTGIDEINGTFPKLELNQVTAEFDYCARQLRLIDGYIQQVNWTAELEVEPMVMEDFVEKA